MCGSFLLFYVACSPTDADGDGYAVSEDCDDTDPAINPGADELCDDLDNDCSGTINDAPVDGRTWHTDADGDGFGDPALSVLACLPPDGEVEDATDCDDSDADIHPGAAEVCDGDDNDCDGGAGDCVLSGSLSTADADASLLGHFLSYAGVAVDRAGDVDGDGVDEIIVGADGINSFAGGAYIVSGTDTGDVDLLPSITLSGPSGLNSVGTSVSGAGDINSDGFDDLLIGSPYASSYVGEAYLFLGTGL